MQRGRDKRRRKRTSPLKLGRPLWRGEDPSILLLLVVEDNRGKPPERWLLRNDTCVHTKRGPKWVVLASPPPPSSFQGETLEPLRFPKDRRCRSH